MILYNHSCHYYCNLQLSLSVGVPKAVVILGSCWHSRWLLAFQKLTCMCVFACVLHSTPLGLYKPLFLSLEFHFFIKFPQLLLCPSHLPLLTLLHPLSFNGALISSVERGIQSFFYFSWLLLLLGGVLILPYLLCNF